MINSEHQDKIHQNLHCWLRLKQPSVTKKHHNLEMSTCVSLKYTMGGPILLLIPRSQPLTQASLTDNVYTLF